LIIQTVHASKGLEYDSVILPLLNNKKQSIRKGRMLTDPSDKSLLFAWKLGVEPGDDYKKIAKLTELQQSRDDLNLLYVAITRAKKRMCLLIQVPPNTKSKENQYYSWARLGMELHGHSEKLLRIENPPAITVKQKSNNPPLVKQSNKLALGDCPKHSPVHADARGFAEKEHSRQEGLKMHAYLQNLLLRWNDTEAFNNILNCPPSVPNARECAVQFLDSFESRGWRHLRRRTEIDLQDGSPNGTKGRADLIVWENDCIHIIDFKHIHKLSKENESIYSQQLNRYADALPQDGIKIRGWLALLKSGVWKELRISKNDASAKVFS
jgi:ATP-dependent exoDNAse (exonuclease V) beta subunit